MPHPITKTTLTALLALLAVPAAAAASSVTYVDGGNVWVASPDGAIKRPVTTDGSAADPFRLPSASDDGTVVAIKGGNSSSKVITTVAPDGTRTDNVMPWKTSTWTNIGPSAARVSPSGGMVAYTYLWNHGPYSGYPNGGFEQRLAIVPPKAPGLPTNPLVDQPSWEMPTWIDGKLVVSRNGALHLETEPLQFTQFLSATGYALTRGEVSRTKDRYLVELRRNSDGAEGLVLYAHTGPFPGGEVPGGCQVPSVGELDRAWGLSPDGTQVAWSDDQGVKVGTFEPAAATGEGFCIGAITTLSPTGEEPAFGAATLTEPDPPVEELPPSHPTDPGQPTPPAPPAPGGPGAKSSFPVLRPGAIRPAGATPTMSSGTSSAPTSGAGRLGVTAPAKATTAVLARGLKVTATAPGAGTMTMKAVSRGKTIATGRKAVRKAGKVTIALKLTKAGRKTLKRLGGKPVHVKATFAPRGGGKRMTSTAKVRLG